MFVREKSARGHTYLYHVENEREGGRIRQRIYSRARPLWPVPLTDRQRPVSAAAL